MTLLLWKGFRFGLLLQFSIGPVCLLVFHTSGSFGFWPTLLMIIGIAMVDALYILLAAVGVASVLHHRNVCLFIQVFGCAVLFLFGLDTILSVFHLSILPSIQFFSGIRSSNLFLQGILVTASNPLTILFWGGVFSTKAVEENLARKGLFMFGAGCVLATLIFLTITAGIGTVISSFLPQKVLNILNIAVGLVIILFGIKLLLKKEDISRKKSED